MLQREGFLAENEVAEIDNAFSSVNEFDTAVYSLWLIVRDQAIYSGGMASVPVALKIVDIIQIMYFFGAKDKFIMKWLLSNLIFIANTLFSAQIDTIDYDFKDTE